VGAQQATSYGILSLPFHALLGLHPWSYIPGRARIYN
jgi:hypothetical protein